ncbi:MAG: MFS transporter [Hydrogenibacillus schlegelii]|uniref:MFS transporter n=1 Tax=Hydrogenibacillus schlegelii TaxID=1484 RepID=A0A2T5GDM4_HYDSH|nr:MFS transporter [Hydrogenibacillus schlegelii]MBT9281260.1 MFS transporter [Hydrogenibacillus schlegelii]PTQ54280.1 MAG: Permeases of the major facilitator superfamily [Hydrogenibacillus schlegelii]
MDGRRRTVGLRRAALFRSKASRRPSEPPEAWSDEARLAYNMEKSIQNGIFAAIAAGIFSSFLPLFAIEALHATDYQVALLSSLPQLVNFLVLIPGALWLARLRRLKPFTAANLGLGKVFMLLVALAPVQPWLDPAWWVVLFVALMNVPTALGALGWQAFIGALIPPERRNRFFSRRNRDTTLWTMLVVLASGLILNAFDKRSPGPYQAFIALAALFGFLETAALVQHVETASPEDGVRGMGAFRGLLRSPAYARFFVAGLFFNFAWQMAWPLFNLYNVKVVQATALWLALFTVANQLSQIIAFTAWGRLAERFGGGPMLAVTAVGMATAPTLTVLSTSPVYLLFVNFFTGLFVAGTVLLLFNELLAVSPAEKRTAAVALFNVGVGAVGFLAPQVGVWLAGLIGLHGAMHLSSLLRLLAAGVFAGGAALAARAPAPRVGAKPAEAERTG